MFKKSWEARQRELDKKTKWLEEFLKGAITSASFTATAGAFDKYGQPVFEQGAYQISALDPDTHLELIFSVQASREDGVKVVQKNREVGVSVIPGVEPKNR